MKKSINVIGQENLGGFSLWRFGVGVTPPISQKMTKYPFIRVPPPKSLYPSQIGLCLPYRYLKYQIKV